MFYAEYCEGQIENDKGLVLRSAVLQAFSALRTLLGTLEGILEGEICSVLHHVVVLRSRYVEISEHYYSSPRSCVSAFTTCHVVCSRISGDVWIAKAAI